MENIIAYNGLPFHYEMFGYVIDYCKARNARLTIYSESKNENGWFDLYKTMFSDYPVTIKNYRDFEPSVCDNSNALFLLTDEDYTFKNEWFTIIKIPIITIDHLDSLRRSNSPFNIGTRPFPARQYLPYVIPTFNLKDANDKKRMISKHKNFVIIGGQDNSTDMKILKIIINSNPEAQVHVIGRKIDKRISSFPNVIVHQNCDATTMYELCYKSQYILLCKSLDSQYYKKIMSGSIPIAFNTGCMLVIPEEFNTLYNFSSALTYNQSDKNIVLPLDVDIDKVYAERHKLIQHRDMIFNNIIKSNPPLDTSDGIIPKNIHMVWYDKHNTACNSIPDKNKSIVQNWKIYNPEFHIKKWHNKDLEELVSSYGPEVKNFFDSIKTVISKCDFSRFLIIYKYGGIYTDVDFYCLKPIDYLINNKETVFFEELPEHMTEYKQLFNGIFAAKKQHPFVGGWIQYMMTNFYEPKNADDVFFTTGPRAFYTYYETNPIVLEDPCLVMPLTNKKSPSKMCEKYNIKNDEEGEVFAVTLWGEGSDWSKVYGWKHMISDQLKNNKLVIFTAIMCCVIIFIIIMYLRRK